MPQLSCESCAQRKVRCDKEYPCSTCKKMNITCVPVQRMRLPRGRHVHALKAENRELRDKLEKLNESLEGQASEQAEASHTYAVSHHSSTDQIYSDSSNAEQLRSSTAPESSISSGTSFMGDTPQSFVSKNYWQTLHPKNTNLNEPLEQPIARSISDSTSISSFERMASPSQGSTTTGITGVSSFVLGLGQGLPKDPGASHEAIMAARPTPQISAKLWDIYTTRVDPITRIFHQPTLRDFVLHGKPYLRYRGNEPVLDLIRSSIFFIGVASLQDDQCRASFGIDKQAAMDTYRSACDVALEQVELIVTEDITVLQSFMLYLLAIRTYDRSRKTWTLFSIAVRLATAIGINEDDFQSYESFFDQQMRRRLWYAMCSMDAHLAFDRASKPLISPNSKHPRLPHNINEIDFGPLSEEIPERDGITDMSLPLMLYRTQATGKGLQFAAMMSKSPPGGPPDPETQTKREKIWTTYETYMIALLQKLDPTSSPANWCLFHNSITAFSALQLTSRRPTKAGNRPRLAMDTEPTNVLRMAVTAIEHDLMKRWDVRGEPFHWHGNTLWNALSIAISECYICNDVLLLQQVWPIIETHFNCLSTILAEYRNGILWQPLERLIAKTRVRVRNFINQQTAINGGMLAPAIYYPLQSIYPEAALTDSMLMPQNNFPPLVTTPEGLLPGEIASPYHLTPAPWSPLQTQLVPATGNSGMPGQPGFLNSAQQPDLNAIDPGWETWDNFLCQINFDMNVQGP